MDEQKLISVIKSATDELRRWKRADRESSMKCQNDESRENWKCELRWFQARYGCTLEVHGDLVCFLNILTSNL